jgi:NAD(P)-dependent dehydrogenase (short-subunit alcohol dehydrogenase family)
VKRSRFSLDGRVVIITGGGGLLGKQHARAVAEAGGIPVLWDVDFGRAKAVALAVAKEFGGRCLAAKVDVTKPGDIRRALAQAVRAFGRVDALINNAANDPKTGGDDSALSRFETLAREAWDRDLAVGLTSAFLCCQIVGAHMSAGKGGVILNIASDLSLIAPDQRLYRRPGLAEDRQPTKPVTYSVLKHGIIGLTRYLATYWNPKVRVNAISPGGIYTGQPEAFVRRLSALIPLGRMARQDEYNATVIYLLSDASSYMTGANLVIDGGRTCW